MFSSGKPRGSAQQEDLANLRVADARPGDVLSVNGAAADFSDVDFTVDRRDNYEAGSRRWYELSGMWRDTRVFLEIHNDVTVEVQGNFDGRKLTLDELGLSEEDLAQIDERQNQSDFFDYSGKFWLYRFSREMGVFSGNNTNGQGFYCWQFREQDTKRYLTIRKFAGEPFQAAIWTELDPGDITVYRGA